MNIKTKADVISLLKTYPDRKRKIDALRYELSHPSRILPEEQMEAMALGHEAGAGRPSGHISDKTLYIALNYQEKADKLNTDVTSEIAKELVALEQEQNRLKYYVSLLERRQAEVIRLSYFEQASREEAAKALKISVRTVQTVKGQAINALVDLYRFTENLH